jgi:hypothetical protein
LETWSLFTFVILFSLLFYINLEHFCRLRISLRNANLEAKDNIRQDAEEEVRDYAWTLMILIQVMSCLSGTCF